MLPCILHGLSRVVLYIICGLPYIFGILILIQLLFNVFVNEIVGIIASLVLFAFIASPFLLCWYFSRYIRSRWIKHKKFKSTLAAFKRGGLWQVYKDRKADHKFLTYPDPVDVTIQNKSRLRNAMDIEILREKEMYLCKSHRNYGGDFGNYNTKRHLCLFCYHPIGNFSTIIDRYVACFQCFVQNMIIPFIFTRFSSLYLTNNIPIDVCLYISIYIKRLCFDAEQIKKHNLIDDRRDCDENMQVFRNDEICKIPYNLLNEEELNFIE